MGEMAYPQPTPREIEGIRQVVASGLPATNDGTILPPASLRKRRDLFLIFLSIQLAYKEDEDKKMALLRCLPPGELWRYYNLHLHLGPWVERWIYGFEAHPLLDPVAPPGLARMRWAFGQSPRFLREVGYLYGLSLHPEVPPEHQEILRRISYDGEA
ncbi:MAG: hypothetical protein ACK41R_07745, partial [Thermus sp.]